MSTYYLEFQVLPTKHNYNKVKGAYAYCWIIENSVEAARNKASFYISKDEWVITGSELPAIKVTAQNFAGKDYGIEQYYRAQNQGIAIFYLASPCDGELELATEPEPYIQPHPFNLNNFLQYQKKRNNSGRCLHYNSGDSCGKIINAHSIQKSGQLSYIAIDGHVVSPSKNIGSLKKHAGKIKFEKAGINKISTFLGFCKKHDNDLFEAIDNKQLTPTVEQIFLYAYRSISKELITKENILATLNSQIEELPHGSFPWRFINDIRQGAKIALDNLHRHKEEYDNSLSRGKYTDIEYTLFCSEQNPQVAFSGLFYPDYDFLGNPLQRLGVPGSRLDLITICSAPMDNGWGLLLAWHKSSSPTCCDLIQTLQISVCEGKNIADTLFRLVISTTENIAFSSDWWENLSLKHQDNIEVHLTTLADITLPTPEDYLMRGLEGISQWKFTNVKDKLPKKYNRPAKE